MNWKPLADKHSISRVRIIVHFKDPLPTRALEKSCKKVVPQSDSLGFQEKNTIKEQGIILDARNPHNVRTESGPVTGWQLLRREGGQEIEEVALRNSGFVYVTQTYDRWQNLLYRVNEVLFPALSEAIDVSEVAFIRLEYWDTFLHWSNGTPDATEVLRGFDQDIPEDVIKGSSKWHSHIGWFDYSNPYPILIQRNIDAVDMEHGTDQRAGLNIHTLAEGRLEKAETTMELVTNTLESLHDLTKGVFANILTEDYLTKVGMGDN